MSGWQIPSIKGHRISFEFHFCVFSNKMFIKIVSRRPSFARVFFIKTIYQLITHFFNNKQLQELNVAECYYLGQSTLSYLKIFKQCIPLKRLFKKLKMQGLINTLIFFNIFLKHVYPLGKMSLINFPFLVNWFVYFKNIIEVFLFKR